MNWRKYLNNAFDSIAKKRIGYRKLEKSKTLKTLERYLKLKQYEFKEWTPFLQEKKDGEFRPLISPPIKDRITLKALADYCSSKLTAHFALVDDVSFAYQKGKGPRDALIKLKSLYNPGNIILKIDIQKFFNNIDKTIIMKLLAEFNLDEYATSLIEKSFCPSLVRNEAYNLAMESIKNGIPQGNPVSAILSNLYLFELDRTYKDKRVKMIRYADDMIFIVDTEEKAYEILKNVENYLRDKRKLSIHPLSKDGKTSLYSFQQNSTLTYLGVKFNGQSLLPSIECQSKLSAQIYSIAKNENIKVEQRNKEIVRTINQWCGYYAFTDASQNRLNKLSNSINHNCHKYLKGQWHDINLLQKFYYYKNKQKRKHFNIFNRFNKKYDEEYDWLICY